MSKRVYVFATIVAFALAISYWLWPSVQSSETINNSPAPRAPAAVKRKLDQVLPQPPPSKALIRLPAPTESPQNLIKRQMDFISRYRVGGITTADGRFEILNLRAVPAARYHPDMGEKIAEKLGYVIFSHRLQGRPGEDGSLQVVAKKSNGMLGIVTGTIIVRLKEAAMALSLADSYKLTLKFVDDDLRLAYYASADGSQADLEKLVESLKKDAAVESVNLEIVNSKKRL